ncbi:hypothetical protein NA56DRAFT_579789 [Hyaloscypha hepaticicola]|uniref:DUF6594 domain-containing protein n=1 Tax=Hyaloscypha hepaticicola TaxID=2082293 RepID=A0A2J6PS35_9HELO|nr:hypothetical protein NA56DRAFT_579789 [Hyaloscypha hepaticicola]
MKGYKKIAALMGKYPELGMVSQFSFLNIQSLLYRQAELIGLQQDLHELEAANDRSQDEEKRLFSRDWYALSSAEEHDGSDEQWRLVLLIREKLKEYSKFTPATLLERKMAKLPEPNPRDLKGLQEWMKRPSIGSVFLIGRDRNVWNYGEDLSALKPSAPGNKFSAWLVDTLTPLYHHTLGRYHRKPAKEVLKYAPNTVHYSDSTVYRIAAFIGTIVASLLPISAIIVLYFITTMPVRLGLVSIFTAIFSVCLWFMTDGRLIEVFSATSAFAAVQVVFISTNISSAG